MKTAPGTAAGGDPGEAESSEAGAPELEPWVRCAACEARVAPASARIAVNGAHEHEFMNPSGLRFVVACYARAPGCAAEGGASTVWSWFPGRAWRIAVCAACATHLGWSFEKTDAAPFHALIRDRVV